MAIIDSGASGDGRNLFRFSHGVRLEVFYALQALTDEEEGIHRRWRADALERLPAEFHRTFAAMGGSPLLWPLLADAPGPVPPDVSMADLLARLADLDLDTFRHGILLGTLHEADLVEELTAGRVDLATAVAGAPERLRQSWFSCIGLHPFRPAAPLAVSLQRIIDDPGAFRDSSLRCLRLFWEHVFADTWKSLEPAIERSISEKRRLFESSSVNEFLAQAVMRMEVDEDRGLLRSVRGGCELELDRLDVVHVLPSAFNARRMFTTYTVNDRETAFLPYFDATISVEPLATAGPHGPEPTLEPALIFKALGDGTRYSMVQLIGRAPRTSSDLARELGVSKATISHHLGMLREAGLVGETYESGSVRLSLRTEVIDELSNLATSAFAPA
jgi:DNA-binding transcriptional ArsR family regulator